MANEGKTIIVAALDGTFQRKVHTTAVKLSDFGLFLFVCLFVCLFLSMREETDKHTLTLTPLHTHTHPHTLTHTYTQPFGTILDLVPKAESVIKLKAVCMVCFKDAAFTKRLGSETQVSSAPSQPGCLIPSPCMEMCSLGMRYIHVGPFFWFLSWNKFFMDFFALHGSHYSAA